MLSTKKNVLLCFKNKLFYIFQNYRNTVKKQCFSYATEY